MTARQAIALVARREIVARLWVKSFYIFTGALMVVILAIGVITRMADNSGPDGLSIAVSQPAPPGFVDTLRSVAEASERRASVDLVGDAGAVRTAVDEGRADVGVVSDRGDVVYEHQIDDDVDFIIQQAWAEVSIREALIDAGVEADRLDAALRPAPLTVSFIDEREDNDDIALLTGSLVAILLMLSLQTFGNYVLMGVIEEKSTAVVELLLARIRSDQLLAGKVIGIGVCALLQFALSVAAGMASFAISGADVPSEIWSTLPTTIVWFLGGYLLYSTLFALAGSLVSRQEDAQAAAGPIIAALVAAYMVVFIFGSDPRSAASVVLSMVPPVAPFMMPMRMAAGAASWLEVGASLALLVLAVVGAWKLAGRIYDQVLLRRGTRISWGEAIAGVRRR
ncbi:MAG: ABC transporter permease [Acidimicrobiia bacterium]